MDKLIEKLSSYEIFAYFMPGLLFTSFLSFFLNNKTTVIGDFLFKHNLFLNILVFLILSYVLGLAIHELSELLQIIYNKICGGFPSQRYFNDKSFLSIKEKLFYAKIASEKFGIKLNSDSDKKNNSDLFFQNVRAILQLNNLLKDIEIFNHNYGLCRSLSALCLLMFILLLNSTWLIHTDVNWYLVSTSIILFIIFLRRTIRFGETYVKKVLRLGCQVIMKENK